MSNTLKQVLLYTFIPLALMGILIYTNGQSGLTSPQVLALVPGGYIVGGLFLLLTRRHQLGKVLLMSGGLMVCITLGLFVYIITTFHDC